MTPRTVAHRAPLSVGFPRPEYWSGLPCPPPGDLPASPARAGGCFTTEPPGKPLQALQQAPAPGGNRAAPKAVSTPSRPAAGARLAICLPVWLPARAHTAEPAGRRPPGSATACCRCLQHKPDSRWEAIYSQYHLEDMWDSPSSWFSHSPSLQQSGQTLGLSTWCFGAPGTYLHQITHWFILRDIMNKKTCWNFSLCLL